MLNCVTLMGRLTADPEIRTTTTGKEVCSFSIAVDRSYAKQGEEKITDFIKIVAWQSTALFISRYFTKGSMIAIQGSIQTRSYEDKDGKKRTAFEVLAREVSFCGEKSESRTNNAPNQAPPQSYTAPQEDFEEIDVDDEDLPF